MNKIVQRLLIFFIGIPSVLGVVFLPYYHELPLHVVICLCSILASLELYALFSKNSRLVPKLLIVTLNAIIPISAYMLILYNATHANAPFPFDYITWVFLADAAIILGYNVLAAKTFEHANTSAALSLLIIFFTGYLITFISRMTIYRNAPYYIATFLFLVFMCDSAAWLFGMLFGKNNRGVTAASPNKSIAGFAGGYAGCVAAAITAHMLLPKVFVGYLWKPVVLGILVATSSIIGDLVESVFKRSAGVKDSGTIILGRGGVLDSIDSILFSAPVFYITLHLLYGTPLL
ncbi:MAG: phosphatidate cytidylyltransferase [Treponema sp.]|nr:phosphatidate cytidylyltransferase [Treponema sp.]